MYLNSSVLTPLRPVEFTTKSWALKSHTTDRALVINGSLGARYYRGVTSNQIAFVIPVGVWCYFGFQISIGIFLIC